MGSFFSQHRVHMMRLKGKSLHQTKKHRRCVHVHGIIHRIVAQSRVPFWTLWKVTHSGSIGVFSPFGNGTILSSKKMSLHQGSFSSSTSITKNWTLRHGFDSGKKQKKRHLNLTKTMIMIFLGWWFHIFFKRKSVFGGR